MKINLHIKKKKIKTPVNYVKRKKKRCQKEQGHNEWVGYNYIGKTKKCPFEKKNEKDKEEVPTSPKRGTFEELDFILSVFVNLFLYVPLSDDLILGILLVYLANELNF